MGWAVRTVAQGGLGPVTPATQNGCQTRAIVVVGMAITLIPQSSNGGDGREMHSFHITVRRINCCGHYGYNGPVAKSIYLRDSSHET